MAKKKITLNSEQSPSSKDAANAPDVPVTSESAVTEESTPEPKRPEPHFPIVGIGASAGGLAAFEAFFSAIPAETETGMAFVLVQHLAPDHKSLLSELVKRYTRMEVHEVEDGMAVHPDCTYIIPPNRDMAILNGTLQLLEPTAPRGLRLPIDFFFRSLAQDQHERAIGIVLSGTGSDGALGVRAIKGEGGMVMAQSPDSTQYDGMPRSTIATGLVDYVLPPAEMSAQLMIYVNHVFGQGFRRTLIAAPKAEDALRKICVLLRDRTGHDFIQYKRNTLNRRVERRMALHQIEKPEQYVQYLQKNPAEIDALFRDLLIGVTCFFRDPEAFAALQAVIPRLFAAKPAGGTMRIWVCGCSSGEEAYSIAMLVQEHLDNVRQSYRVQIFATDIDPQAIEQARLGAFPASIAADVSSERLARFFSQNPESGVFRIKKAIRDLVIFSEQDVIKDPPFSKLDLISCRNLLIYMNADLQKRLIPLFHYALNPQGMLFLGTSESVGEFTTLFSVLDRKAKLYRREDDIAGTTRTLLGEIVPPLVEPGGLPVRAGEPERSEAPPNLRELTERTLLQHYAQAGVLINGRGEILHVYGRTGQYLELAPGDAGMNILSMAREGLRRELTTTLHRTAARKEPMHYPGLRVKTNGDFTAVNLTVRPVDGGAGGVALPDLYLVILEEAPPLPVEPQKKTDIEGAPDAESMKRIAMLEQELQAKEEYLQTTLEEMETSNEELKSINEEMQSVNEELQSTNEELETSKEELQSVNEELATVNAELQTKVADLSRANNDMNNMLAGTGVATLFVDHQLRIARFTPATTHLINLIQSDIGRPVGHIVSNLVGYDRLVEDTQSVLDNLIPQEREVQTNTGVWYQMYIRPYRTLDNIIEGAVITFIDITQYKQIEQAMQECHERWMAGVEGIKRLQRIGALCLDESNLQRGLDEIMEAALAMTSTDLGTLELLDPSSRDLRIVAYRGFEPPWLAFWDQLRQGRGISGTALEKRERVIIEDMSQSPLFADPSAREISLAANVQAMQATPLVGRSGRVIGLLSTYFRTPHRPDEGTLRLLDLLARQITDMLERPEAEDSLRHLAGIPELAGQSKAFERDA